MKKYISSLIVVHSIWFITSCNIEEEEVLTLCDEITSITASYTQSVEYSVVGSYREGDVLSVDHQGMEFNYCYPSNYPESSFSFSNHSEKVFMLEMSATW